MAARHSVAVHWSPLSTECNYLEDNFVTCIKEKSLRDDVPEMKCKVEYVSEC